MTRAATWNSGLAALLLLAALFAVTRLAGGHWGVSGKESELRDGVVALRTALDAYHADHGFYPGAPGDANSAGDPQMLVRQLTQFTDAAGNPSPTADDRHRFGPYLAAFPAEAITGSREVTVDTASKRLLPEVARAVEASSARGGWFYEAKSGVVVPNLGRDFEKSYARF